jgi:hypothetical protein
MFKSIYNKIVSFMMDLPKAGDTIQAYVDDNGETIIFGEGKVDSISFEDGGAWVCLDEIRFLNYGQDPRDWYLDVNTGKSLFEECPFLYKHMDSSKEEFIFSGVRIRLS